MVLTRAAVRMGMATPHPNEPAREDSGRGSSLGRGSGETTPLLPPPKLATWCHCTNCCAQRPGLASGSKLGGGGGRGMPGCLKAREMLPGVLTGQGGRAGRHPHHPALHAASPVAGELSDTPHPSACWCSHCQHLPVVLEGEGNEGRLPAPCPWPNSSPASSLSSLGKHWGCLLTYQTEQSQRRTAGSALLS